MDSVCLGGLGTNSGSHRNPFSHRSDCRWRQLWLLFCFCERLIQTVFFYPVLSHRSKPQTNLWSSYFLLLPDISTNPFLSCANPMIRTKTSPSHLMHPSIFPVARKNVSPFQIRMYIYLRYRALSHYYHEVGTGGREGGWGRGKGGGGRFAVRAPITLHTIHIYGTAAYTTI